MTWAAGVFSIRALGTKSKEELAMGVRAAHGEEKGIRMAFREEKGVGQC